MSCFGIGIRLTQAEKAKLSEIANTALYTAALINDCHSWPKELKHHLETQGSDIPFNAVCILMRQYKCSDTEAIERLREKYVELQERHLFLVRKLEQSEGVISDAHRKYIMAAQYAASGSEFWSIFAPRYPTKEELKQPECLLVDDVFQWKHALTNGHQEDNSAVPVNGAVATNGVKSSQVNGAVAPGIPSAEVTDHNVNGAAAPGIPSAEVTDHNVNGVNGSKHENGYIGNTNRPCNGTQHLLKKPSDDVSISTFPSIE